MTVSLVTGTGRCGTKFVAELLRAIDIRCTHEGLFGLNAKRPDPLPEVEVSWLAGRHAAAFHTIGVPMVMLVRDPWDVLQSLVGIGFPGPPGTRGMFRRTARRVIGPALDDRDPFTAAVVFQHGWWRRLRDLGLPVVRVEDLCERSEVERLVQLLGLDAGRVPAFLPQLPSGLNHRARQQVDRRSLAPGCAERIDEMATADGYRLR